MVSGLILPLSKQYGFVNLRQLLSEMLTGESSIHWETFGELGDVLHVKPLGILLQVIFPVVNAELCSLIWSIVAVDSSHGMSTGHLDTGDFSVDIFEALKQSRVVDVALGNVVEQITNVP